MNSPIRLPGIQDIQETPDVLRVTDLPVNIAVYPVMMGLIAADIISVAIPSVFTVPAALGVQDVPDVPGRDHFVSGTPAIPQPKVGNDQDRVIQPHVKVTEGTDLPF